VSGFIKVPVKLRACLTQGRIQQVWRVTLTAQFCESAAQPFFLLPSVNATWFAHARSIQKSATGVYWNGVGQFLPGVVQAELRRRSR
jgi:hypothetical protein